MIKGTPMLTGTVEIEGNTWEVTEEKRAGPQKQLFSLVLAESPHSRMHVRPLPGQAVSTLDEVAALAADPAVRWFADSEGVEWEARLVVRSEPNSADVLLVKFISEQFAVHEGPYPFRDGLGARTDADLRGLLEQTQ
ncbi:MAG: hypothetical protein JSW71_17875 [Gemmatimonadota bacterium]|nr:MAG: hypothetical protein JSW71_17875 [Gemmatimonadota bacterium]